MRGSRTKTWSNGIWLFVGRRLGVARSGLGSGVGASGAGSKRRRAGGGVGKCGVREMHRRAGWREAERRWCSVKVAGRLC